MQRAHLPWPRRPRSHKRPPPSLRQCRAIAQCHPHTPGACWRRRSSKQGALRLGGICDYLSKIGGQRAHTPCLGTAARGATNGRRMPEYPVMKSWTSLPSQAFDLEYRAPFSEVMFHFSHLHFSTLGESCFMQFSNGPQVNQSVMTSITIVFRTVTA